MLGLGGGLSGGVVLTGVGIVPSDIAGLDLWLQFNKGVVGADGGATADGDMADGEDINSWADQSGNDRHASQVTVGEKPHWETDAADLGGLVWTDRVADPHLDIASDVSISANQDFTIMMRVKISDFGATNALVGSTAQNVIKWNSNLSVKSLIGGTGELVWAEASDTIATDTYYIHTLTRSGGAAGNLEYRIHGSSYDDKSWDAAETHQDADAYTINNIGSAADGVLPLQGVVKDVMIWKGTALSTAQRTGVIAYVEAQ